MKLFSIIFLLAVCAAAFGYSLGTHNQLRSEALKPGVHVQVVSEEPLVMEVNYVPTAAERAAKSARDSPLIYPVKGPWDIVFLIDEGSQTQPYQRQWLLDMAQDIDDELTRNGNGPNRFGMVAFGQSPYPPESLRYRKFFWDGSEWMTAAQLQVVGMSLGNASGPGSDGWKAIQLGLNYSFAEQSIRAFALISGEDRNNNYDVTYDEIVTGMEAQRVNFHSVVNARFYNGSGYVYLPYRSTRVVGIGWMGHTVYNWGGNVSALGVYKYGSPEPAYSFGHTVSDYVQPANDTAAYRNSNKTVTASSWDIEYLGGDVAIPTDVRIMFRKVFTGVLWQNCDCATNSSCATYSCSPLSPLADQVTGCISVLDDTLCDDGNACTVDTCGGSIGCLYPPLDCSDGIECTLDLCDSSDGCYWEESHPLCDDGVDCTNDTCVFGTGCTHPIIENYCSDGNLCTDNWCDTTPNTGGCREKPTNCDDGVPCTKDSCHPDVGCRRVLQHDKCEDDIPCTIDECTYQGCLFTPNNTYCDVSECGGSQCVPGKGCLNGTDPCCNYLGVPNKYWNNVILPSAVEDMINRLERTASILRYIQSVFPEDDVLYTGNDVGQSLGTLAQINKLFVETCLESFCDETGNFLTKLENILEH